MPKFSAFVTDSNAKEKKDRGQLSELGGLKISGKETLVRSAAAHGQAPLKQHTFPSNSLDKVSPLAPDKAPEGQ